MNQVQKQRIKFEPVGTDGQKLSLRFQIGENSYDAIVDEIEVEFSVMETERGVSVFHHAWITEHHIVELYSLKRRPASPAESDQRRAAPPPEGGRDHATQTV